MTTVLRAIHRFGWSRPGLLISVLCALLGFGFAVQVQSNSASGGLAAARQEDLVLILDDLSSREERLRLQVSSLQAAKSRLTTSGDQEAAALTEARGRATSLGILAGTVAAQGPGVRLTISDPASKVDPETLLGVIQELRAAGAETIQVGDVRIGLDSSVTGGQGSITVDDTQLEAPYVVLAIGDPSTLSAAMNIPGGVTDMVSQAEGQLAVEEQPHLEIRALRALPERHYAQPSDGD